MHRDENKAEFDPANLMLSPEQVSHFQKTKTASRKSRRERQRREAFIRKPWWWAEKMVGCAGHTYAVADFLLYEAFRQHSPKIKLPNGMLERDGISRMSKLRALRNLEQRGLVSVAWRKRKSPIVTLNL